MKGVVGRVQGMALSQKARWEGWKQPKDLV